MPIALMLKITSIFWGKIQIFCRSAYGFSKAQQFYELNNCPSEPLSIIDIKEKMFDSFVNHWAGCFI